MSTWPRKKRLRLVPFSRRISARSTSAGSLMTSAPPSPQVRFLVSWKLSVEMAPSAAERRGRGSGRTGRARCPRSPAGRGGGRSPPGRPSRSRRRRSAPARIARVRGVIAASTSRSSRLSVSGRMSTNTGTAPRSTKAFTVDTKVNAGQITSSPGPTSSEQRRHLERVRARRGQQHPRRAGERSRAPRGSGGEGAVAREVARGQRLGDVLRLAAGQRRAVEPDRARLAVGTAHRRPRSLTAARVSRSTSRRRIVSRLSCSCLPRTRPAPP